MDEDLFTLVFTIPHTEPKTPIISHMQHSVQQMADGGKIPEDIIRINILNNSIWVKSEFAKRSLKIIEDCYSRYGRQLDDGNYKVSRARSPIVSSDKNEEIKIKKALVESGLL